MRSAGLVATIALAIVTAALLLLMRPLLQEFGADKVVVELGVRPSPSERARAVDDHVLEAIEGGSFGQELRLRLDRPASTIELRPFFIDQCEVKQGDFERFAQWRTRQGVVPPTSPGAAGTPRGPLASSSTGHRVAGLLSSPASGVTLEGAALYCEAAGGRLPWAEEFEAAAAGQEGRLYAWGDEFDPGVWPYLDPYRNASRPCGSHPESASPDGVQDLNGNAMEWSLGSIAERAANPFGRPQPTAHGAPAVRSRARALYALNAAWLRIGPQTRSHHLGFRCVYEGVPRPQLPWGGQREGVVPIRGGTYPTGLPEDVRLARLALLLPEARLRNARQLLASSDRSSRRLTVGRCEVTRGEYAAFLRDPLARLGLFANRSEPDGENYTPADWKRQREHPELPVTGVTWWAADAFARWTGGRLPRVEEWELMVAGEEGRLHPWGNRYDPEAASTADLPEPGPRPCPAPNLRDATPAGVMHLAGNVSEWSSNIAAQRGNYSMWVQGGNWLLPGQVPTRASFGRLVPLEHRSPGIGFRVVYED